MGAQQSKEELLYHQVNYGNADGIKALRQDGAGLEWVDKEGKTPLIVACMRPDLLNVVLVLIELGANVNAYRPGAHAGTPLHHAAKRGLDQTVNLLLSKGANPLVMNDDCHTPLDLARAKGHCNVVRAIEGRICLFCGWLRELYGPSILEAFAPQWLQRKIWAVVLPCDSRNPTAPRKFELAIYPDLKAAQPRTTIPLWKVHIEEPKFNQSDPTVVIVDKASSIYDYLPYGLHTRGKSSCRRTLHNRPRSRMHHRRHGKQLDMSAGAGTFTLDASDIMEDDNSGKKNHFQVHFETRYRFLAAYEGDKQQLQWFHNACRGIPQQNSYILAAPAGAAAPTPNPLHPSSHASVSSLPATSPISEDAQLAMANNASIQTALSEGVPVSNAQPVNVTTNANSWEPSSGTSTYNGWGESSGAPPPTKPKPAADPYNGWSGVRPSSSSPQLQSSQLETAGVLPSAQEAPPSVSIPTAPAPAIVPSVPSTAASAPFAPPLAEDTFYDGPIHYPSIDSSPVNVTVPPAGGKPVEPNDPKEASSGGASSSSCVICLDAPVEGACIPCGHMAGCMSCLNEIKGKQWGCPVCRANIDQVVRLFAV